jgi:hypothetical protein
MTDLRMTRYSGCQGTTIPSNRVSSVVLLQFYQATQFIKDGDRSLQPRSKITCWNAPPRRKATAYRAHEFVHLFGEDVLGKHIKQLLKDGAIGFGEHLFPFRGQFVDEGGFITAAARSLLSHKSIALKRCKVSPDSIIREVKCVSQFLHRLASTTKEHNDASACAGKKALISGQHG